MNMYVYVEEIKHLAIELGERRDAGYLRLGTGSWLGPAPLPAVGCPYPGLRTHTRSGLVGRLSIER